MRFSTRTLRLLAWLLLAAAAAPAIAGPESEPSSKRAQRVGLEVGFSYWEAAGAIVPFAPDLAPNEFGRFDTEGWSVGFRYLVRTAESRSGSLWLGAGLNFLRHRNTVEIRIEEDGFVTEGDLGLRGLVLGAQAEWMWRSRGPWRPFAVAGLEYQQLDAAIEIAGVLINEYPNARGLGASVGMGTEVRSSREPGPLSIRALALARWFDFGSVPWAEPTSPELSGPSYQVALGFTWTSAPGRF